MTEMQDISLPTPAIVIAAGNFAVTTAAQIKNIYLRGDPRRKKVTNFLTLSEIEGGSLQVITLDTAISEQNQVVEGGNQPVRQSRQSVFQETVNNIDSLRVSLEQALYDIRSHELLIEAGWAEEYDVPVNLYLLADIKDPFASGVILPLSCLLQDISENTHLCRVHALFNTAVFPPSATDPKTDLDVEVYTFLLELDDLLQEKSRNREKLTKALGCESSNPLSMTVYLFDCHKEGSYVVKNNEHMQIMMGNALLSLMEKDLARRVIALQDPFEVADQQSFYNSIGAVAIAYDPASLQQACARKIAHEFLATTILSDNVDAQNAANEAEIAEKQLGNLHIWLERCVFQLPPAIGHVRIVPDTNEFLTLLTDLRLAEIDYEHFRDISWVQQIRDYAVSFEQETRPLVQKTISSNAQQLENDLSLELSEVIEFLPIKPSLYPGGIQNAMQTLRFLSEYFSKEGAKIQKLQSSYNQIMEDVNEGLEKKLEQIRDLLNHAPKLPWIIRVLPKFARIWVAPIFYAYRFGKQIVELQNLKEESIELVQKQSSSQIQAEVLNRVDDLIPRLVQLIEKGGNDYQILDEIVGTASAQLSSDWPKFPLGQPENGWDEVFRVPVVEHCFSNWAFTNWHPSFEKWVYKFLAEESPFIDWRRLSSDAIIEWLSLLGSRVYSPLWQISLDDIFRLWEEETPGFTSNEPISPELISMSMRAAIPLLHPDFDAVGGSGLSSISSHGLVGKPEWQYFKGLTNSLCTNNLEQIYTGDPFVGLFLQIRHSVPLNSLTDMIRSGKHKFFAMSEEKKQAFVIFQSQGDIIRLSSPDEMDSTNADVIHKIFKWKFKPKGSGDEIEQSISLEISRSRFEHYRRVPRFNDEWNRYAEEEMPEIRAIALEFQRLHSSQKWSTYNQAFNVLKFVQSCIPYSYDKDTTGMQDWSRYPIETLVDGTGDCEDAAILCAAIIARLGLNSVLFYYLPVPEFNINSAHVAFGVAGAENLKGDYVDDMVNGVRYFYGEATSDGWHLGQIPVHYKNVMPKQILPVKILLQDNDEV
jgi:hypothetical protein